MQPTRFLDAKTGAHPFTYTPPETRLDIVVISVDMIPPELYRRDSAYAPLLRVPHLRALQRDSVAFTNAFACSPLCGPSRAAYLTGRYPYLTVNEERAHDGHAVALRAEDAIFPEYLKAVGYHTRHVGKAHVGTALFLRAFGENDAPWDRWAPPMTDDDGYMAHLRRLGVQPPRFRRIVQGLAPDRQMPGNSYGGWVEQADGAPFPLEATYPFYLATRAVETLQAALATPTPRPPLYLQLDFFAPHQPFMIPADWQADPRAARLRAAIALPESYEAARARDFAPAPDEPRIYEVYRRHWGLYDAETMRDYIWLNLLQVEVLDAALGRFLEALRATGVYDDALLFWLGDHGEMNGERALIDKGVYAHPKVARVPLHVKLPGNARAGSEVNALVSLLDLAPTVLEVAGVRPCARLDGVSLAPLLAGEPAGAPRALLFEAHWHVAPNPCVALIWEPQPGRLYMYAYNLTSDVDELYDLADPAYRNVATSPEFASVKMQMIRELGRVLRADPRWRCYWHPFRLDKYAHFRDDATDMQMFRPEC